MGNTIPLPDELYFCPRCLQPCEPDEEGVPRCRDQSCPEYMTINENWKH